MRGTANAIIPVAVALLVLLAGAGPARANLPTGYLVWSKGTVGDRSSRKIYRMTLPGKTDIKALTSGEDVESQISPDGKWVAYAKTKIPMAGEDYHNFHLWKLYLVSIHGMGQGRKEIKIDDDGYWPSWGDKDVLYYNRPDGGPKHSQIVRVTLDSHGQVKDRQVIFSSKSAFGGIGEVNECFLAPDASWFAARTRGSAAYNGVGAFQMTPPKYFKLAQAGSVGCMPYVAPSGKWGFIAGAEYGIRWGHAPGVTGRQQDQLLIPAQAGKKCYHPGISTDGQWMMTGQGTEQDHNAGRYDIYLYALNPKSMTVSGEQALASGGFNGWPHLWVGTPTAPPPPRPRITAFYPSSYTITKGSTVTLTWTTSEAEQVALDGQPVSTDGTQKVQPTATTTYTLVAKSSKVSDIHRSKVTVKVNATAQAVAIQDFSIEPQSIEQGRSATVKWRVNNPTTLDLNGERLWPEGSLQVSPLQTTTFVLTARGHQGPVTSSVTLTVTAISDGLLPDRGGFLCHMSGPLTAPDVGALLLLLLLLGAAQLTRGRTR